MIGGEIELRLDRPVRPVGIGGSAGAAIGPRHRRAEFFRGNTGVAHILRIDGGDGRRLRQKLGLGLADQLRFS